MEEQNVQKKNINNRKLLMITVLTALFSALSFALTYVHVPLGSSMIHLGNFVCIIAALLFGPIVGGVSGSLGMGLYDLVNGYNPSSWIRTFITKFFMGLTAGLIYKSKKNSKLLLIIPLVLFLVSGILTLVLVIIGGGEYKFMIANKSVTISNLIPIFSLILAVIFTVMLVVFNKFDDNTKCALIATSYATILNIILEFILRTFLGIMDTGDLNVSFITAITKIPSSVITGLVTIVFVGVAFKPLDLAIDKSKLQL